MKTNAAKNVLVIGADRMSSITDYTDRSNAILWGDGAGAVILTASNDPGILSTHIHADGKHEHLLHAPRNKKKKANLTLLKCREIKCLNLPLILWTKSLMKHY